MRGEKMEYTQKCIELVKSFEGYHTKLPNGGCRAYWDKLGEVWTIGYGCTECITEDTVWSYKETMRALCRELDKKQAAVNKYVKVPLTSNQNDALVSFTYNVGEGALSKSTLLKYLNKGDYVRAAKEFTRFVHAKGQKGVVKGLLRRRKAEQALFLAYPKKELVKKSSKLNLLQKVRNIIKWTSGAILSLFTLDSFNVISNVADKLKEFFSEHCVLILIFAGISVWLLFKYIEFKTLKDHEEGRYTPKGVEDDNIIV